MKRFWLGLLLGLTVGLAGGFAVAWYLAVRLLGVLVLLAGG